MTKVEEALSSLQIQLEVRHDSALEQLNDYMQGKINFRGPLETMEACMLYTEGEICKELAAMIDMTLLEIMDSNPPEVNVVISSSVEDK